MVRLIRFRADVAGDFNHPVQGPMLSLAPLSVVLAVALWARPGGAMTAGGWGAPIALAPFGGDCQRVVSQVAPAAASPWTP